MNGVIYTTGNFTVDVTDESSIFQACYWTGKVRTALYSPVGSGARVYGITVVNGNVYTAEGTKACYWTGTSCTDLGRPAATEFERQTITLVNGTVYTGGEYYNPVTGDIRPCYWTGTLFKDPYPSILVKTNYILGIFVDIK